MCHALRRLIPLAVIGAVVIAAVDVLSANGRRFYADDPLQREPESQDASAAQEWDIELLADLAINLFATPSRDEPAQRAGNVNTIDEVPDSSWFTNRVGAHPIDPAVLARGPLNGNGPAPGRWSVIAPKKAGAAPGFTMRDAAGEVWFVSFDSAGYPEAATGAILVANKIFWGLGYWQVEHHPITVDRDQLDIAAKASFTPLSGKSRPMRAGDLDDVFVRAHRSPDGTYRAVAGRGVPGRIIGGFRFHGTRPDDPNDVVPHQHRRELRALKVFGAWTNLVDLKAGNTLDTIVADGGRQIVRHYLQDVGSTFGTGANGLREYDEGWEHLVELDLARKRFFRFGLPWLPWHHAKYEPNHSVGRFEGDVFDPVSWKPRVPTAAFLHARADDEFWAARRVAAFSDEMIDAVVKTARFSRADDERLLAHVLKQRRDKIARAYLTALNPLVNFSLTADGRLTFRNAAVDAAVADPPRDGYLTVWSRFANTTNTEAPIGSVSIAAGGEAIAPGSLPDGRGDFVKIAISARGTAHAVWTRPVDVYFRRADDGWSLVGIERMQ